MLITFGLETKILKQRSLQSGHFTITPTDMNFHRYIDYEGKGIIPDIPLDFDRDWIEQTLEIIEKDKD